MGHQPQASGRVGLSRAINIKPQAKILPTPLQIPNFDKAKDFKET
jgi:hypothetical protein